MHEQAQYLIVSVRDGRMTFKTLSQWAQWHEMSERSLKKSLDSRFKGSMGVLFVCESDPILKPVEAKKVQVTALIKAITAPKSVIPSIPSALVPDFESFRKQTAETSPAVQKPQLARRPPLVEKFPAAKSQESEAASKVAVQTPEKPKKRVRNRQPVLKVIVPVKPPRKRSVSEPKPAAPARRRRR